MIEQTNIINRDLNRVLDGDSSRLKLSSNSRLNIETNLSEMSKVNVETSETPKVTVYDNTAVKDSDMGYVLLAPERVPVSARSFGARAVKTKKEDNIKRNGGMSVTVQVDNSVEDNSYIAGIEKTVGTNRSNYSSDVTVSKDEDNYSVNVNDSDGIGYKVNGRHNIAKQMEHFEEKKNEPINSEAISQEDNKAWVDINFANAAVDVDNNKVEDSIPERKHEVSKNVPEYGTSSSDVFGETPLRDEALSSYTEKKAEAKSVVSTNDLINTLPNSFESHESKAEAHEEKKDQLTDVHNKLFGIGHETNHVTDKNIALEQLGDADIDNMSIEDIKQFINKVKVLGEDAAGVREKNVNLEQTVKAKREETTNLTNVVKEAKMRYYQEALKEQAESLKVMKEEENRSRELQNDVESIDKANAELKEQLQQLELIGNEIGTGSKIR